MMVKTMKIDTRALNFTLLPEQIGFIERRLKSTLGSNGNRINFVEVYLTDIHSPDYASDYRCLLRVELESNTMIVSESIDSDLKLAIHRAADRAGWKIARCLGRQQRQTGALLPSPPRPSESRLRCGYLPL